MFLDAMDVRWCSHPLGWLGLPAFSFVCSGAFRVLVVRPRSVWLRLILASGGCIDACVLEGARFSLRSQVKFGVLLSGVA